MKHSEFQRAFIRQSFKDAVFNKETKRVLKRLMKQQPSMPITSLLDDPRIRYSEDGTSAIEYGWVDPNGCTDEEVKEYFDDQRKVVDWPVQWDCSGQLFTVCINWMCNSNGMISYIHRMAVDI